MKRNELLRHLRRHGCYLKREGGAHSLWVYTHIPDGINESFPGNFRVCMGEDLASSGGALAGVTRTF